MAACFVFLILWRFVFAQWSVIWTDPMDDSTGGEWTYQQQGDYLFASTRGNCPASPCLRLRSTGSNSPSYVARYTNVASYSQIRIKLDVHAVGLEDGDSCEVWYKFTDAPWYRRAQFFVRLH